MGLSFAKFNPKVLEIRHFSDRIIRIYWIFGVGRQQFHILSHPVSLTHTATQWLLNLHSLHLLALFRSSLVIALYKCHVLASG
jgi:hypothetical protein